MSVAPSQAPSDGIAAATPPATAGEACPLCGAPLHATQEWCLRCGAAARTRLAASPSWKRLIAALAVVVVLALGVLAGALVKLAGGSGTAAPASTRTVTTAAALAPSATSTAPSSVLPGAAGAGASARGAGKAATSPAGGKAATAPLGTGKAGTSPPVAGKAGSGSQGSVKLSAKAREAIARAVRERLGKLHLGNVLPSTGTR